MPIVVDSYAARNAAQLDQLGAIGLVAYIGNVPNAITKEEHDALIHAGKDVAVIIEHTFDAWRLGWDEGHRLGLEARAAARALGRPDTSSVGLAVDDNIQPHMLATAVSHVQGFRSAAGVAWIYGTAYLIDAAFKAGLITHGMQSCSTGFFDNLRVSAHSALHQHCHPGVDTNDVLLADWGQEPSSTVVPTPTPTPGAPTQEDTVIPLTLHDLQHNVPDTEEPYIDIAPDGHSILAFFVEGLFGPATHDGKVTNGFGLSALHLEPGETAVKLAARNEHSILVVLSDHSTRIAQLDPAVATAIL